MQQRQKRTGTPRYFEITLLKGIYRGVRLLAILSLYCASVSLSVCMCVSRI